jgi:DNA-binding SARP family transcriptional activator
MHPSEVTALLGRGQAESKEIPALKKVVAWLNENVSGVTIRVTSDTLEALGEIWVDSRDVDAAIDSGNPTSIEDLYTGEFLEGFKSGSAAFDDWAKKERGRLKRAWTHAMIAAARKAEQQDEWESVADWWHILVARAPMRPEAVASLLHAYVMSGQEQKAGLAYAEYASRLEQSGIPEPAEPVRRVLAEHTVLQDITGVHVELTPDVEPAEDEAAELEVAESEDEFDLELLEPADVEPLAAEEPGIGPVAKPDDMWPAEEFPEEVDPAEEEWQDVVDLASTPSLDLGIDRERALPVIEDVVEEKSPEIQGEPEEQAHEPLFDADELQVEVEPIGAIYADELSPVETERTEPATEAPAAFEAEGELGQVGSESVDREGRDVGASVGGLHVAASEVTGALGSVASATGRALGSVVETVAESHHKGTRALRPLARRFAYALIAVGAAALVFAFGPRLLGVVGGLTQEMPEVNTPDLPKVSLPKVVVPKMTLKTPSFVEISVSRIGDMFSGPILDEPGQWVVVADFGIDVRPIGENEPSGAGDVASPLEGEGVEPTSAEALPSDTAAVPPDTGQSPGEISDTPVEAQVVPEVAGALATSTTPLAVQDSAQDTTKVLADADTSVSSPTAADTAEGAVASGLQAGDTVSVPAVTELGTPGSDSALSQGEAGADLDTTLATSPASAPTREPAEKLSLAALATALEADLAQSAYFNVAPRERALLALSSTTGRSVDSLSVIDALAVADSVGYAVVVSGWLSSSEGADSLKLLVLNSAGDTLYGVAAELSAEMSQLETLAGLARAVRRRFGEADEDIESSRHPARFLTSSPSALNAYAEARRYLYAGRYSQAVRAASEATQLDTTFSLAYATLADAYAQGGVRMRGRSALEEAWRFRDELPERDRIRIEADRFAWDGLFSEAAVGYDDLFQRYRQDVGALKSQALMQRMIGARGSGEGNLQVAYTIDPYDWPRLSRIARYLGYTGPLPDVDSLVAALEVPEEPDPSAEAPQPEARSQPDSSAQEQ